MALVDFHTDDHINALVDVSRRRPRLSDGQGILHVRIQGRLDERGIRLVGTAERPPLHNHIAGTVQ